MSGHGLKVVALLIGISGLVVASVCQAQELVAQGAPNGEKLGWRLGCQAYSFNRFTFYEAVDKTASLGLKWIEAYPGQNLSEEKADVKFDHTMSPEIREEVKAKLRDAGVTLVNYGVVGLSNDEAASRAVFEFAKDMGIETIVSEPPPDAFELVDRLCEEYDINVAIHNHPKPSRYWNPETVVKVCEGRSKRIGACADTGHWMRSGIEPLDALKMLEGRIISFHIKNLNAMNDRRAHDVPWGTGAGDMKAWLAEVKRQGVKGVFSIEYEHNWMNSVPEIAQCVTYFDKVAAELASE
jgi:sugar phosphate isomerase/epimerase